MSKSNVNPDHYKAAGRERQGENILQERHRQKHAQSLARERFETQAPFPFRAAPATLPEPAAGPDAGPPPAESPTDKTEPGKKTTAKPATKATAARKAKQTAKPGATRKKAAARKPTAQPKPAMRVRQGPGSHHPLPARLAGACERPVQIEAHLIALPGP
jgi:hypothetical protein